MKERGGNLNQPRHLPLEVSGVCAGQETFESARGLAHSRTLSRAATVIRPHTTCGLRLTDRLLIHLIPWDFGEFGVRVAAFEVVDGPLVAEEDDPAFGAVLGGGDAAGDVEVFDGAAVFGAHPAEDGVGCVFDAALGVVFAFEAELDDFKLQGADGTKEGDALTGMWLDELLHDTFAKELFQAVAEALVVRGAGVVQVSEDFGGEAGDFVEAQFGIGGEGVADAEAVIADDADDIARVGFIHGLAILSEEFLRVGEADDFAGAGVGDLHVAFELAADDADETHSVAMARVHVGLDLEDKAGEAFVGGLDDAAIGGHAWLGWRGEFEEAVEEHLHAEVVAGAAKEDGGEFAAVDLGAVVGMACAVEHFELHLGLFEGFGDGVLGDEVIIETADFFGGAEGTVDGALEEMDVVFTTVIHAAKLLSEAEGPVDGAGTDAEDGFEFVEEGEGLARRAVELVHEGEDGHATAAADFEELAGLGFDAFAGVDDHDGGIDGGEDAVGVFGEVFVTGGVEEVHDAAFVLELEDGGTDGDAALLFELHPVGGGGALVFASGHGTRERDGAAVEQELFGERRFTGVGVRNDREGTTAGDLGFVGHGDRGRETSFKEGGLSNDE